MSRAKVVFFSSIRKDSTILGSEFDSANNIVLSEVIMSLLKQSQNFLCSDISQITIQQFPPTTGLAPQARRNMWELISEIKKDGKTIILTTHYMEEAEILCDRVAIIDSGKIVKIDSPKNLISELLNSGFVTEKRYQEATLEDVFLDLTGKSLREY